MIKLLSVVAKQGWNDNAQPTGVTLLYRPLNAAAKVVRNTVNPDDAEFIGCLMCGQQALLPEYQDWYLTVEYIDNKWEFVAYPPKTQEQAA